MTKPSLSRIIGILIIALALAALFHWVPWEFAKLVLLVGILTLALFAGIILVFFS